MKTNLKTKLITLAALAAFTVHAENGRAGAGAPVGAGINTNILKVSEYMMSPKSSWAPAVAPKAGSHVAVTEELSPSGAMGFRVIHLRKATHGTKAAAVDLAASGLLQPGDVFLSYRPEWNNTLAYAHMQLGISHTGLAFIVDQGGATFVHTLESPMSYSGPMNHQEHYADLNAIHVIRPKLDDTQKKNLKFWAQAALAHQGQLPFFKDYGAPFYMRGVGNVDTPRKQIQYLGEILNDTNRGASLPTYCSEFAWTFLGLRNCGPRDDMAKCVEPIFTNKNVKPDGKDVSGALTGLVPSLQGSDAGLIQGPEAALAFGNVSAVDKLTILTTKVFQDILSSPDELAGKMSSGHRAVAEQNSGLMTMIREQYYKKNDDPNVAKGINSKVVDNFSPTSFMIRANAGLDDLKYVGTIVWDRDAI
jgi:hypothetical protein